MWKDLSLKEKAELIKLYVSNGITNRRDIIADYNSSTANEGNLYGAGSWLRSSMAKSYDTPTFDEAFRQARIDGRNYFKWNGNRYSTELAPNPFVEAARAWDTKGDLAKRDFVMQIIRDPKGVFDYYNETYSPEKGYKSVNKKVNNYDIDTMYSLGIKGIEGLVIPRNSDFSIGDEIWNELKNSKLSYAQKVGILANSFHETDGWTALKQYGDGPASGVFMMEDAERKNYNKWLKDNGYVDSVASQTRYVVNLFNNVDSSLQTPWDRASNKQEEIRKYKDESEARKKGYRSAYNHIDYTTDKARKDWKSDNTDDTVTAFEGLYERAGKPQLENRKRIAVLLTQKYKK